MSVHTCTHIYVYRYIVLYIDVHSIQNSYPHDIIPSCLAHCDSSLKLSLIVLLFEPCNPSTPCSTDHIPYFDAFAGEGRQKLGSVCLTPIGHLGLLQAFSSSFGEEIYFFSKGKRVLQHPTEVYYIEFKEVKKNG